MATTLLTTKFFPPPARVQIVPRPRLVERLAAGLRQGRKLALVSAPAGFGKTTLVVEAIRCLDCRPAWLSLDGAENEPVRFWRYFITALRRVEPGVGEIALGMLEATHPQPLETVLTALLNDLADLARPLLLVLDDYHVIEEAAIHDSLNFLLDHLSPQLQIFITTRADPPLALARRRGRMEIVEVRAADLRFTRDEAAQFLNSMRLGLSAEDVDVLLRRTEGWAAGLQMAALAMQSIVAVQGIDAIEGEATDEAIGANVETAGTGARGNEAANALHQFVASFAGDDQYIGDYLVEEVLQRQPAHIQSFLLQTSVLERFCASLCDEVTSEELESQRGREEKVTSNELESQQGKIQGLHSSSSLITHNSVTFSTSSSLITDNSATFSSSLLHHLDRSNLFLIPLDNRQDWYRYHRLFAELLQRRLLLTQGAQAVARLHERASRWFERHQLWAEAFDHALKAGDEARAADLLERASSDLFMNSELLTLREWVHRLPEALVLSRPVLCIQWAWAALSTSHSDEAIRAIDAVEKLVGMTSDVLSQEELLGELNPGLLSLMVNIDMIRASIDLGYLNVQRTIERSQRSLRCLDRLEHTDQREITDNFRTVAFFNLALSYEALGEMERAMQAFAETVTGCLESKNIHILPMAVSHLAQIQTARGRLDEALETYQRAFQMTRELSGRPSPLVSLVYAGLGGLLYERNDLAGARENFERSLALSKPWNYWESMIWSVVGLARLLYIQGEKDKACAMLDDAARGWQQSYRQMPNTIFLAWRALLSGEPARMAEVLDLMEKGGPPPDIYLMYSREVDLHLRARLALKLGRLEMAREILDNIIQTAEAGGRQGPQLQALVLRCLLLQQANQPREALAALEQALALAEPGGYVRTFVDEGLPLARMLYAIARQEGPSSAGGAPQSTNAAVLAAYASRLLAAFPAETFAPEPPLHAQPGEPPESERAESELQPARPMPVEALSQRELEVLRLVAEGLSNNQIAARLFITPGTVKVHTNNIYAKLGVSSRTAAVAKARALGIL